MFKEYKGKLKGIVGEKRTNTILRKSLFLVVQSSNDIASTYFDLRKGQYDFGSYSDLLVAWASSFFKVIFGYVFCLILVIGNGSLIIISENFKMLF